MQEDPGGMPARFIGALRDSIVLVDHEGRTVEVRQHKIGSLVVRSGALVACDPFAPGEDLRPFATAVAAGCYPVRAGVATYMDGDLQGIAFVAYVTVHFQRRPPVRWEMARLEGQETDVVEPGQLFGYAVDTGVGCFMDDAARRTLYRAPVGRSQNQLESPFLQVLAAVAQEQDNPYLRAIDMHLDRRRRVQGWVWAQVTVDRRTGLNIVAFTSGYGDGQYASYFGYDAVDQMSCLTTSFNVLRDADRT